MVNLTCQVIENSISHGKQYQYYYDMQDKNIYAANVLKARLLGYDNLSLDFSDKPSLICALRSQVEQASSVSLLTFPSR